MNEYILVFPIKQCIFKSELKCSFLPGALWYYNLETLIADQN